MIKVSVYSAQKHAETGNGSTSIAFDGHDMTDKEIEDMKKEIRAEIKEANRLYRLQNPPLNKVVTCSLDEKLTRFKPDLFKITADYKLRLDPKTGNTSFLVGSSKAGKSTLLMNIYNKYYKDYITTLYTINDQIELYNQKKLITVDRFDNDRSAGVSAEDMIRIAKKINQKTKNKYEFCFMLDDIVNEGVRHSKILNEMVLTLRNSNISSLVSIQYSNILGKKARGSVNNMFFFRLNNDESIVVALKSFLSSKFAKLGVIGLCDQMNFYKELTKDHAFIYYHPASDEMSVHRLELG